MGVHTFHSGRTWNNNGHYYNNPPFVHVEHENSSNDVNFFSEDMLLWLFLAVKQLSIYSPYIYNFFEFLFTKIGKMTEIFPN